MKFFCAKCGKNINQDEMNFYKKHFLCSSCYIPKTSNNQLKNQYTLYLCSGCMSYVFDRPVKNSAWKNISLNKTGDIISNILKTEIGDDFMFSLPLFDKIPSKMNIFVSSREKINQSDEITLLVKNSLCKTCNKLMSRRFDAVIQLRTIKMKLKKPKELLRPILDEIISLSDNIHQKEPEQFISDIEEHAHGYDLKLSIKAIMTAIQSYLVHRYAFIVKSSKKLIGKNPNTGGDLYRTYILLRYIPFQVNTHIRIKNNVYLIKKIQANRIVLENLATNSKQTRNYNFFEKKLIEFLDGDKYDWE